MVNKRMGAGFLGAAVLSVATAQAGTLTFDTSADYTNNFRAVAWPGSIGWVSGGYVQQNGYGGASTVVYDTTPGDSTSATATTFSGPFTVSYSVNATVANGSIGVFFVDPTLENSASAQLVLLNIDGSGSLDRVRFFNASSILTNGTIGSTLSDRTSLDSGIETGSGWGTVTVTYSVSGTDAIITLSAGNNSNFIYQQDYGAGSAITNPEVALRVFGTTNQIINIDDFSVNPVPEAASLSLLSAAGLLLVKRRRH